MHRAIKSCTQPAEYRSSHKPDTAHMLVAQGDFGNLGIRHETERGSLLHVVDHPALSRKCSSDKNAQCLEGLELRCESRENLSTQYMDHALDELLTLFTKNTISTRDNVESALYVGEPVRRSKSVELFRPPRRFPRRTWIRLVKRMYFHGFATTIHRV